MTNPIGSSEGAFDGPNLSTGRLKIRIEEKIDVSLKKIETQSKKDNAL
jgi:hypothetical protein